MSATLTAVATSEPRKIPARELPLWAFDALDFTLRGTSAAWRTRNCTIKWAYARYDRDGELYYEIFFADAEGRSTISTFARREDAEFIYTERRSSKS